MKKQTLGKFDQQTFKKSSTKNAAQTSRKLASIALVVLMLCSSFVGVLSAVNISGDLSANTTLSSEIDDALKNDKPVFLFFYADRCHFCQQQKPIIDELEKEYARELAFIRINVNERPDYAEEFGVSAFPTMFIISDKNEEGYVKQEISGFTQKTRVREIIALGLGDESDEVGNDTNENPLQAVKDNDEVGGGTVITASSITCDSCFDCNIKLTGNYDTVILTTDITNHAKNCIRFSASNVVFDGGRHTIDGVGGGGAAYGIAMSGKSGNTVKNCVVTDFSHGIYLIGSSDSTIIDNDASNNDYGIILDSSSNIILSDNTMVDCGIFIEGDLLEHWNTHTIVNSNRVNNKPVGYWKDMDGGTIPAGRGEVILANCNNTVVENQDVSSATVGVQLGFSSGNKIVNNTCNNNVRGISLWSSSDNHIEENHVTGEGNRGKSGYGIYLGSSSDNHIEQNNYVAGSYYGIYLHDSSNENEIKDNTILDNDQGITLKHSNSNNITENDVSENGWYLGTTGGIELYSSCDNRITNNTLEKTQYDAAIYLDTYSVENTIILNNFIDNQFEKPSAKNNVWSTTEKITYIYNGFVHANYMGNYWSKFSHEDEDGDGIRDEPYEEDNYPLVKPWKSENYFVLPELPIHNINTSKNFSTIQEAIYDSDTEDGHTITVDVYAYPENVVVNKPLTIRSTSGNPENTIVQAKNPNDHVFNVTADYVNISGLTVRGATGGTAGIYLYNVKHCNISDTNASDNYYGMYLEGSSDNIIINNILINNTKYGVCLDDSSGNNLIYHNNFMCNWEENACDYYYNSNNNHWDNGYPSGGNYWDDYEGEDKFHGPYQNLGGSDGIGDSSYAKIMSALVKDNYPFMVPNGWITAKIVPGEAWNRTFGGGYGDCAYSVQQTSDSGYIIAGYKSLTQVDLDVWLIKTDENGNEQWNRTFGGINEYEDRGYSVVQATDGGYIIAGIVSCIGLYGEYTTNVWLIKTDENGIEQWNKTFGGAASRDQGHAVQQTIDGGYIIAGDTGSDWTGSYNAWLIKTDENGIEQWNRTFGETNEYYDHGYSVQQTTDGGYIIAGDTTLGAGSYDAWLIKTDENGIEQWNKTFGGASRDHGHSVQQTTDGGYIIAGYTGSFGAGSWDAWLIKTDENGNEQWNRTFGGASYDHAHSVQHASDGGYILAGYLRSFGAGFYDAWLIKTDENGIEQWNRTLGGKNTDYGYSVQQTQDGNFIVAGSTSSYGVGGSAAWLVKVGGPRVSGVVHNLNTGYNWDTIQEAIDDSATEDGHTITVDPGTYNENVNVNKRLTIRPTYEDPLVTSITSRNKNYPVFVVNAHGINISGFTISGSLKSGIFVNEKDHCNISNNILTNNGYGIMQLSSNHSSIKDNQFSVNMYGISLISSHFSNVIGNAVNSSQIHGISLDNSDKNNIESNILNDYGEFGLYFEDNRSYYNTIVDNIVSDDTYYHYLNADGIIISDLTLDVTDVSNIGKVSVINSTGVTIRNLNLSGNSGGGAGLFLHKTTGSEINNIEAWDNTYGILLDSSDDTEISASYLWNSTYGLSLKYSAVNSITENHASNNYHGIHLYNSADNTISNNNFSSNYDGLYFELSSGNSLAGDITSNNSHSGICLNASSSNTFSDITAQDNSVGVYLEHSSDNSFTDYCDFSGSKFCFFHSDKNSANNVVSSAQIDTTEVSFNGKDIMVTKMGISPPVDPMGYLKDVGKYFDVGGNSPDSWIEFNVSYSSGELDGIIEETLTIYRYNDTFWEAVPGENGVEIANKNVYVKTDSFGLFAPMGTNLPTRVVSEVTSPPCMIGLGNYHSIQNAVDAADSGDIIVICRGCIHENVHVTKQVAIKPYSKDISDTIIMPEDSNEPVIEVQADGVGMTGFTIEGEGKSEVTGIVLNGDNGNITNLNIFNSTNGIEIAGSHNRISDVNVSYNNKDGIYLSSASDNEIMDCIILNNSNGIYLLRSSGNNITNNMINYNEQRGIKLVGGSYNSIIDNEATSGLTGISLWISHNNGIVNNNVEENTAYGIRLSDSSGNDIYDNTAFHTPLGVYLTGGSEHNTVRENDIQKNSIAGIKLVSASNYNHITNNTLKRCDRFGIWIYDSDNNNISGNIVKNNDESGIWLQYSNKTSINNNLVKDTSYYGVTLWRSHDNNISENMITENNDVGIYLGDRSEGNTIENNSVLNNGYMGIYLDTSSSNIMKGNTIMDHSKGIELDDSSSYNKIINNSLSSRKINMLIKNESTSNLIYHNNFLSFNRTLNNADDQVSGNQWDNGYPSGGNWWCDYDGIDVKKGPDQDQPGSDGIGDEPYDIGGVAGAEDRYPFTSVGLGNFALMITTEPLGRDQILLGVQIVDPFGNPIPVPNVLMKFIDLGGRTSPVQYGAFSSTKASTNEQGNAHTVYTFRDTQRHAVIGVYCRNEYEEHVVRHWMEYPTIFNVQTKYGSYFLEGIALENELGVEVNWEDILIPVRLEFEPEMPELAGKRGFGTKDINVTKEFDNDTHNSRTNQTFNMTDMPVGTIPIKIIATSDEDTTDEIVGYYFHIVEPPGEMSDKDWKINKGKGWEVGENYVTYYNDSSEKGVLKGDIGKMGLPGSADFAEFVNKVPGASVPKKIPFIGGKWGLTEVDIKYNRQYKSNDAILDNNFKGNFDFSIPPVDTDPTFGYGSSHHFVRDGDNLRLKSTSTTFRGETGAIELFKYSVYVAEVGAELKYVELEVVIIKTADETWILVFDKATGDLETAVCIYGQVDIFVASAKASGGGVVGVGAAIDSAGDFSIESMRAGLLVRFDWKVFWYKDHWGKKWIIDLWTGNYYTAPASEPEDWHVIDRDYICDEDYAKFVANLGISHSSHTDETMLVQNVFPEAHPQLALGPDDEMMIVYTHDDPTKSITGSFEIYYMRWNGTGWSAPMPITDNNIADVKPVVKYDSNGNAVAAWASVNRSDIPEDSTDLNDAIPYVEIAYSIYNSTTLRWSEPAFLTSNNVFDYLPSLAADESGNVMAVWMVDEDNQLSIGSEGMENHSITEDYYYSIWDGSQWTAPGIALDDIEIMEPVAFDFDTGSAMAVWSQDTDDNSTTTSDREIFYANWDETTGWSVPIGMTTNAYMDKLPQVVYERDGIPMLVWATDESDENVTVNRLYSSLCDGTWSTPTLITETYEINELRVVQDPRENPVAVWQQLSGQGVDIYYSVFDSKHNSWGAKNKLTNDTSIDLTLTPVINANNDILSTYLKSTVVFENDTILVNNETFNETYNGTILNVTISNIINSSIYLLKHHIFTDLEISDEDIELSNDNPAPGDTITINATVHNVGDLGLDDIRVRFSDGKDGPQIGSIQTIDFIASGYDEMVQAVWTIPVGNVSHEVYVEVDPLSEIAEENETNNAASLITVLPDLMVERSYTKTIGTSALINTTISNMGFAETANITVGFYVSDNPFVDENTTLIGTKEIHNLASGECQSMEIMWDMSSMPGEKHYVFIVADHNNTIPEGDEGNNVERVVALASPDISIKEDDIVCSDYLEGDITLHLNVSNMGSFDATNVTVQVFRENPFYINTTVSPYNPNETIDVVMVDTSKMMFESMIPLITAGSTAKISRIWSATQGRYDVYVLVDPNDDIAETNEHNNIAMRPITIQQRLDLVSVDRDDLDGDGMFEYIVMQVEADIETKGEYITTGLLRDNTGKNITNPAAVISLEPGTQTLTLNFSGIEIRETKVNGPFTIEKVELYDTEGIIGSLDQTYTTPAYDYTDFSTKPVEFIGSYSDYGVDTDGDGLYNFLTIEVGVNVTKTGNYSVQGLLYDKSENYITSFTEQIYLGQHETISLNFDGLAIRLHEVDGPYSLTHIILYSENWDEVDSGEYVCTTSAYNYTDFTTTEIENQPPTASFTYTPENQVVDEIITFNASGSYDPDGTIVSYEWNFGDGNITNTAEKIITHSYAFAGGYNVNLTVTDNEGAVNSTSKVVTVQPALDTTSPASITNLQNITGTTWINWTWTNPADADFNYTMVYLNGTWQTNTSCPFFNATGLVPNTYYEIGTRTVGTNGNVNETWVNQTAKTKALPDTTTPPIITFVPPTPANNSEVNVDYVFVNVTLNENGNTTILNWNGTNETMLGSGMNFYLNKTGLSNENYTYRVYANDTSSNWNVSETRIVKVNVTLPDTTPPASITNLQNITGTTWINWTWTNPLDTDFNYTMVYLNGTWKINTSCPFYNATGPAPDTYYEIGTHTVDKAGNINTTWVNQTTKTQAVLDTTPPSSITNLQNVTGQTWINWTWTNPPDADFNHTMVYLNGTWQTNTSYPFYNATGLVPDTYYEVGTHTVDKVGNINTTWVNQTAKTKVVLDTTPPTVNITNPPNAAEIWYRETIDVEYTVSDICDASPAVVVTPSDPILAPLTLGDLTITVIATDASGNIGSDSVIVTVIGPMDLKEQAVTELDAAKTGDKKTDKKIDDAIKHIQKSLEEKLWEVDEVHLDTKHGKKVFDEEKKAVKHLTKLCKCKGIEDMTLEYTGSGTVDIRAYDKDGTMIPDAEVLGASKGDGIFIDGTTLPKGKLGTETTVEIYDNATGTLMDTQKIHTSCSKPLDEGMTFGDLEVTAVSKIIDLQVAVCPTSGIIKKLVQADEGLAKTALDDAIATPVVDTKKQDKVDKEIAKAEDELAKAEDKLNEGKPDKAIDHYKKAWEHAQHAIKHAQK